MAPPPPSQLQALRNELHVWTFENVGRIAETYRIICPAAAERAEEIAAPLRVMAHLCGDQVIAADLEAALARNFSGDASPPDLPGILVEAARALVRQGYREVTPPHIIMEMRRLAEARLSPSAIAELSLAPETVGRLLRATGIIPAGNGGRRQRFMGKLLRVYPLSPGFLDEADRGNPAKAATDFCVGCIGCPYQTLACPFMRERMPAASKGNARRI